MKRPIARYQIKPAILLSLFSLLTLILSCGPDPTDDPAVLAVAKLYKITSVTDSTYSVTAEEIGAATFSERDDIVTVTINATGLTPNNRHSVHIHEGTCEAPGSHWNQGTQASFCRELNLGTAWAKPYAGDIGNIRANDSGAGFFELSTEFWRLGTGDNFDITGKLVIIHSDEEDFAQSCFADHTHLMNTKIACGTIELITND